MNVKGVAKVPWNWHGNFREVVPLRYNSTYARFNVLKMKKMLSFQLFLFQVYIMLSIELFHY